MSWSRSVDGTLPGAVGDGAGQAATVATGAGTAHPADGGVHHVELVQVVKAPRHDAGRGVGQVKGVTQLMERRPQTRRVVGPVEVSETHTKIS